MCSSTARLFFCLILYVSVDCQLYRVSDWFQWKRECGLRSDYGTGPVSWYALVRNEESEIEYGAVIISQRHVITVKIAVTKVVDATETVIDNDNIKVIPIIPIFGEKTTIYDVEKSLIPVKLEHEFVKPILLNLVILQVSVPFHGNVTYACPMANGRYPEPPFVHSARSLDIYVISDNPPGREAGSVAFDKTHLSCTEKHCEEFLTKQRSNRMPNVGDVWYTIRKGIRSIGILDFPDHDFDYIVGIELNSKYTMSIAFWADFICKHTGACTWGIGELSDVGISDFHYMLDGKLKFDTCSEEQRRDMIRQSTPFRRIDHAASTALKRQCGRRTNTNILEEAASFLVTIVADRPKCIFSRPRQTMDCKQHREYLMCSGVLISPLHVVTSAECLKKILLPNMVVAVFFTDHEQYDGESFPFQEDDLIIHNYDTSRVGKRWLPVDRVTTPYTGESFKHDIALMQLERPIPLDSHIKPICVPLNSMSVPEQVTVVWNEEKTDPTTKIVKRTLKSADVSSISESCAVPAEDCEIFTINTPFKINNSSLMGSPVFHENDGQKYLIGYVSLDKNEKEIVIRPSYFTSFICIHTGVCDAGESFKSRLFMMYEYRSISIPQYIVLQELQEWKSSNQLEWSLMEHEMHSVVQKLADHKYRLNRLTAEEYEEVKHVCGKIPPQNRIINGTDYEITEHPWAVTIAMEQPFFKNPRPNCGGSFISRRHVITARHCVNDGQKYVVLYGSTDPTDFSNLKQAKVKIVSFTDRYEAHVEWYYDLAILELFENIQLSRQTQLLCIGDHSTYKEDAFHPIARVYGGGKGKVKALERTQYMEYNFTSEDPNFIRRITEESYAVLELGWESMEGRSSVIQGDSGGPLVRRRLSDDRHTLYGIVRTVQPYTSLAQYTLIDPSTDSICKMSGVCPDGKIDTTRMHEITVNGLRLC